MKKRGQRVIGRVSFCWEMPPQGVEFTRFFPLVLAHCTGRRTGCNCNGGDSVAKQWPIGTKQSTARSKTEIILAILGSRLRCLGCPLVGLSSLACKNCIAKNLCFFYFVHCIKSVSRYNLVYKRRRAWLNTFLETVTDERNHNQMDNLGNYRLSRIGVEKRRPKGSRWRMPIASPQRRRWRAWPTRQ